MNAAAGNLFDNLASETKRLLASHPISDKLCRQLARMTPERQIEAAQLMLASGTFTAQYVRTLVCATEPSLLSKSKSRPRQAINQRTQKAASDEITALATQLRALSDIRPSDILTLLAYCQYAERIMANNLARKYIDQRCPGLSLKMRDTIQEYWGSEFLQFGRF